MNPAYGNWREVGEDIAGPDRSTFSTMMAALDRRWLSTWREERCLSRSHPGRPILRGEIAARIEDRRRERWVAEENARRDVSFFASVWTDLENTSGSCRREWVPATSNAPGHWRRWGRFAWVSGTWTQRLYPRNEVVAPWSATVDDRFRRKFPPWIDLHRSGFGSRGEAMAWADDLLRRAGVYFEPEMVGG